MVRKLSVTAMLLYGMVVAAQQSATVVIDEAIVGGSVSATQADSQGDVTLTVTPAPGYIISRNDVRVMPMVAPEVSESRCLVPIAEPLPLTGDDPEDLSASRQYTFNMGDNYSGAYVTATFHEQAVVTVTMGDYELRTYCADVDLDFSAIDGLEAYIATAYTPTDDDNGKMKMQQVTSVPAGTGLLLRGTPGAAYTVRQAPSASVLESLLVGVVDEVTLTAKSTDDGMTNLVLASLDNNIAFYPVSEAGLFGPNKAYLQLPTSMVGSRHAIALDFEDAATAVTPLPAVSPAEGGLHGMNAQPSTWYDLQGRKLGGRPLKHGVYLINGKKVVR
jgi:hypothetical protein